MANTVNALVKERSTINNSTSKAMFAFSKEDRFKSPKSYTSAFGYEIPGQFGHKKDDAQNRGFGSSVHDRFGYEEMRKVKRGIEYSGRIDGPD